MSRGYLQMKQTIRIKLFETNSSSNHTIVITNTAKLPNLKDLEYNIELSIQALHGDFDDSYQLTETEEKLAYLYRYKLGYVRKRTRYNKEDYTPEDDIRYNDFLVMKTKFQQMFPKCKFSEKWDKDEGTLEVSINHQSTESKAMDTIFEDELLLRYYLSDACTVYLLWDDEGAKDFIVGDYTTDNLFFAEDAMMGWEDEEGHDIQYYIQDKLGADI